MLPTAPSSPPAVSGPARRERLAAVSPRLSVIVPTHNRAGSVGQAVASVLAEDADLEVVVVDDGSHDDTPAVLAELCRAEGRVRAVRNETALGLSGARNRGLAEATADVVGFCDDDDRWEPGVAATLLAYLDAHPRLGVVSCWHTVWHTTTDTTAVYRGPTRVERHHLLWQNLVGLPFGFIRRSALPVEVVYDPAMITGEDWDLWLRLAAHGPLHVVPFVGFRYAQHGGQRLSRQVGKQVAGRRAFLAKHGDAMSSACRRYHETVIAQFEGGRPAMRRALRAGSVTDAAVAATVLATSRATHHLGVRRGDPGLQARVMARLLPTLDRGGRRAPGSAPVSYSEAGGATGRPR